MLDALADAGVCSLKIEGRLKKPDYVRNVVSAYRMMLDTPPQQKAAALKEARLVLAGSYGRKWSHGFSTAEDMESLIQFDSAGVSGRLAGSVEKTAKNGFEASVIQRLHIGDRIRIQPRSGDEGPSITITRMSRDRTTVKSATKGSRVFIHCDKEVKPRSMIYKIGESSAESVKRPADMPLYDPQLGIGLNVKASAAGLEVEALLPDGQKLLWSDTEPIDTAENRPLQAADLEEAFAVTRNEQLSASKVSASISEPDTGNGLFLPAGRLKKTRRAFWEWLEQQEAAVKAMEKRNEISSDWQSLYLADRERDIHKGGCGLPVVFSLLPNGDGKGLPAERINALDIDSFINGPARSTGGSDGISEVILPFFCPEDRLEKLSEMIKEAAGRGIKRFRITGLYQLKLVKEALGCGIRDPLPEGISLTASFPLPAANSLAARELKDFGVSRVQIWLELDREGFETAAGKWPVEPEIYRGGKPFLLATRAALSIEGKITDSRGKEFFVEKPPVPELDFSGSGTGSLSFVFPAEVISLPAQPGCAEYFDLGKIRNTEKETGFNYDFTLV